MKASVYTEYGPPAVLHLEEVATPEPKENEVLIRVRAANVNYGDLTARNFANLSGDEFHMPRLLYLPTRLTFGVRRPRQTILGNEFTGDVAAVGREVRRFREGDAVFAYTGAAMGAYAEARCMAEDGALALKPAALSYTEAATVPYGGLMAASILSRADLGPGRRVLINGASGGIGSLAVQLCKQLGAEVTGVCGTPRLEMVRALGADHVIDYSAEDFTANGQRYDVILDVLGTRSFREVAGSLTESGRLLPVSFQARHLLQMARTALGGGKRVICALANESAEALERLSALADAGAIEPVIDRCFPLAEAAEAHEYVESGRRTGNVVIQVA